RLSHVTRLPVKETRRCIMVLTHQHHDAVVGPEMGNISKKCMAQPPDLMHQHHDAAVCPEMEGISKTCIAQPPNLSSNVSAFHF
ncbi:MAG: hypothetical protein ACRCVV_20790, partial [Shewanella sp.]